MNTNKILITLFFTFQIHGSLYSLSQDAFNAAFLKFAPAGSSLSQAATYIKSNQGNIANAFSLQDTSAALGKTIEADTTALFLAKGNPATLKKYFPKNDTSGYIQTALTNAISGGTTTDTNPTTNTNNNSNTNTNANTASEAAKQLYDQIQQSARLYNDSVKAVKAAGGTVPVSSITLTPVA